ncbi:pseudouridine synthase [Bimuria novae-zelandiae CBS 107.79]|uniref:tRNA pseudouridine(55) synthase n=1 Tax=Bimuria novae-zelandiae CBS 107.79 TaxID=1447943 RepID=A0A6A5VKF9_9PLEO|nr:pseudouridine synthase [Bimuria novae-zelandiae CBS 107.79]
MDNDSSEVLEGVFAICKPSGISSGQALLTLQNTFSTSTLFAPLLAVTRAQKAAQAAQQNPSNPPSNPTSTTKQEDDERNGRFFRMGHGGTLDPLASGILIIGLGRGTKALPQYIGCRKTYSTVILFGKSTDTYDIDGAVVAKKDCGHVSEEGVRREVERFRGTQMQVPPVYSALKIDGVKACEYVRAGRALPRELEAREVCVEEVEVVRWLEEGVHGYGWKGEEVAEGPAVRVRLTVSSGFYVRSFAHDLGVACGTLATMAELVRTRQAGFIIGDKEVEEGCLKAVDYEDLQKGEEVWGPVVREQLVKWVVENPVPVAQKHVDGRDPETRKRLSEEEKAKTRQRFRGEWQGTSRRERRRQQKAVKANANGQNGAVS